MKLPAFRYKSPATLTEAVRMLAAGAGNAKALAGGQSFIPVLAFRLAAPAVIVDLRRVPGLDRIGSQTGFGLGLLGEGPRRPRAADRPRANVRPGAGQGIGAEPAGVTDRAAGVPRRHGEFWHVIGNLKLGSSIAAALDCASPCFWRPAE